MSYIESPIIANRSRASKYFSRGTLRKGSVEQDGFATQGIGDATLAHTASVSLVMQIRRTENVAQYGLLSMGC